MGHRVLKGAVLEEVDQSVALWHALMNALPPRGTDGSIPDGGDAISRAVVEQMLMS